MNNTNFNFYKMTFDIIIINESLIDKLIKKLASFKHKI